MKKSKISKMMSEGFYLIREQKYKTTQNLIHYIREILNSLTLAKNLKIQIIPILITILFCTTSIILLVLTIIGSMGIIRYTKYITYFYIKYKNNMTKNTPGFKKRLFYNKKRVINRVYKKYVDNIIYTWCTIAVMIQMTQTLEEKKLPLMCHIWQSRMTELMWTRRNTSQGRKKIKHNQKAIFEHKTINLNYTGNMIKTYI